MRRLVAAAAAIALVVGAWALRSAVTGGQGPADESATARLRLTCASELARVCEQLATSTRGVVTSIEDPGVTADALAQLDAGADPGFDGWLVDGPWAAMVADDRTFTGAKGRVLGEPSPVLGRSPAVVVVQAGRQPALEGACGGTITWRCIGDQSGALRVGLTPPERGDGLVALSEATASFMGTTDYSTAEFEDPAFTRWFDGLTRLSANGRTNLGGRSALATAVSQAGTFNVVGALEAQASSLLRDRSGWATIYPDPMSTAEVQLVPRAGADAEQLLERLGRAPVGRVLVEQGWRTPTDRGTPDRRLAGSPGLPSPGVLNVLRDQW